MKYKWGRLCGRCMELVVAVILTCGFLNIIPWLLLLYSRPDLEISSKIKETDVALAQIAQILIQRIDELGSLAEDLAPMPDNPLMSILSAFLNNQGASTVNEIYNRDEQGQFLDGTTQEWKEKDISPEPSD